MSLQVNSAELGHSEAFSITYDGGCVEVVGSDDRGLLYGVTRLLRVLNITFAESYTQTQTSQVLLSTPVRIVSWPRYPVRGHQLGYRPKAGHLPAALTLADK